MTGANGSLRRAEETLRETGRLVAGHPDLGPIARALEAERSRLDRRVRIAVVGRISQGKSTLVNALLGQELAATGALELTCNINHLRYSAVPGMTVRFTDGRPPLATTLADLSAYTAFSEDERELLAAIDYIDVACDNDYLQAFDLIDTPGLDGRLGASAEKTLAVIGRTAASVRGATLAAASAADALLVVIDHRGAADRDEQVVSDFLGPDFAGRTPVTTLGALTKIENLWGNEDGEPMEVGARIAAHLMGLSRMRQLLFELRPVCGLIGQAAATLDGPLFDELAELAEVPEERLDRRLRGGGLFARPDVGLPLPPARRAALYDRFSAYGLHLACGLIRHKDAASPADLREALERAGGVTELRTRLVHHFGERAELLKLRAMAEKLTDVCDWFRPAVPGRDAAAIDQVRAALIALTLSEHRLEQLDLLQRYASGQTAFPQADRDELLRLFGEHGRGVAQRLGLPPDTPLAVLHARAEEGRRAWARRLNLRLAGTETAVARTAEAAYGWLARNIREARDRMEDPR